MREPTPPDRRSLDGLPRLLRPARWRTSPPRPGSRPTRSTASPRCSSTCCATSSPPTSRSPSTSAARPSARRSTPSTRPAATRPPTSSRGRSPLVQEILDALRIPWVEVEGYEADDVLATLTTQATAQGIDVLICSGDRDALQLVRDDVTVLYPVKGVSELARMTPEAVRGQVRRPARALQRPRRPGRRVLRQPAGRARRRAQDGGQVDQPVRRPHRRRGARRPDQGQGR